MAKQLIVKLRRDGTVDAETAGMHGAECMDYICALENLLEAQTMTSSFTDDYAGVGSDAETEQRDWDRS
ncbi:Protein of unknown function [Paramicrobacterium humi]|uniref:DUF2997 domain-containing protein n=1 Tax=Paramicrobacterium humi TaxID=640635 RepID=A0A1H4KLT9_9MICO|nr:DUF2997 domain-containing protein [Microbacterium humi]SEB59524.1 Protein of unknown function [Microbacterium humi]